MCACFKLVTHAVYKTVANWFLLCSVHSFSLL